MSTERDTSMLYDTAGGTRPKESKHRHKLTNTNVQLQGSKHLRTHMRANLYVLFSP